MKDELILVDHKSRQKRQADNYREYEKERTEAWKKKTLLLQSKTEN